MRLADTLLQQCIYQHSSQLNLDPSRDFGLTQHECDARLKALRTALDRQQQLLWANNGPAMVIWLQGPDCSGKDGVIRNSLRGIRKVCASVTFKSRLNCSVVRIFLNATAENCRNRVCSPYLIAPLMKV